MPGIVHFFLAIAWDPGTWVAGALRALYPFLLFALPYLPQLPQPQDITAVQCRVLGPSLQLLFFAGYHCLVLFEIPHIPSQHLSLLVHKSWPFWREWGGGGWAGDVLRTFPVKEAGSREENNDLGKPYSGLVICWSVICGDVLRGRGAENREKRRAGRKRGEEDIYR